MQQSSTKIIVKVGKKSDILFHGVQTFRAITLDEMIKLTELHPDASIIVIENIKAEDVQRATDFIREFEARGKNNQVYFYTPDNDLETGGIADELAKESYLSKQTLYSAIENTSKVVVTTDISRLKEASTDLDNPFDAMWVMPEDGAPVKAEDTQQLSEGKDNISDTGDTQSSSEQLDKSQENTDTTKVEEHRETEEHKEVEGHSEDKAEANQSTSTDVSIEHTGESVASEVSDKTTKEQSDKADGTAKDIKGTQASKKLDKQKIDPVSVAEQVDTSTDTSKNTSGKAATPGVDQELLNKAMGELRDANAKLATSNAELEKLRSELSNALSKNKTLSELVKAVESERDTFQDRLRLYGTSEVMEEPITLSQYQDIENKLKALSENSKAGASPEEIAEFNEKIRRAEESATIARQNLEDYKSKLRESGTKLSEVENQLTAKLEELDSKQSEINRLESVVEQLKKDIQSNEQQQQQSISQSEITITELKSQVGKLESDIVRLNASIQAESEKANLIQSQLTQSNQFIEQLKGRIDQEVKARLIVVGILSDAVREIQSQNSASSSNDSIIQSLKDSIKRLEETNNENLRKIAEYDKKMVALSGSEATIRALQSDRDRLTQENAAKQTEIIGLQSTITSNRAKISELELQVGKVDSQVEMAKAQIRVEVDVAKRETQEVRQSLAIVQQQLKEKTSQYEALVQSSGINENGVSSLLETNKVREEYNRQLIVQVEQLRTELEKTKKEATVAKQTAIAMEQSNKSMRDNMESMSALIGNKNMGNQIKPIKYTSRGVLIPVFGSGSYGITTTAMSLANRLAAQARVLYIDLDMVSPRSDGWFRKQPILNGIMGTESMQHLAKTGLGILVEKQIQFFINNFEQIVIHANMTKSGCIDYISGFMLRPELNKMLATDWSAFLNFCGERYAYIVVDMGRIGSSDISDQLIKGMVMASYKSLLVSTIDRWEISQIAIKLNMLTIDKRKIAWLINMCKNTKIDDSIKKQIAPAPYFMMLFNQNIYGMKLNFGNDALLRDKFYLFLDEIVFPRKKGQ